ncbi:LPS export ABC transporter periplasmic protein LptC [Dongia sp. agr-C8]
MADRTDIPELSAPRRVFKRKRNKGLINALKIGLPLIAVACVAYIAYWSRQVPVVHPIEVVGEKTNTPSQSASDVKVQKVQYNGVDASNRPYSITAESASQPQKIEPPAATGDADGEGESAPAAPPAPVVAADEPDNVINLQKLMADMTMSDGAWVALTADNGVFHRDQGTVDLSGNVTLFHDTGLSFETDAATVDLKNDWASGNQPVEGQNADGQLAAQGFEIRDDGKTILFTGRSYLKLFPKKSGGGS